MSPLVLAAKEQTLSLLILSNNTLTNFSPHKAPVLLLKKTKVFLSNVDELIVHLTLHLLLQNDRAEPAPYSHIN